MQFKAWDNKNKRWIENFFINKFGNVFSYSVDTVHSYQNGACIISQGDCIDSTLCRSIGLKDKNGVEVFENDIVKAEAFNPENYQIEFVEGGFALTNPQKSIMPIDINFMYPSIGCQMEKIGNVFDNENLLKGGI